MKSELRGRPRRHRVGECGPERRLCSDRSYWLNFLALPPHILNVLRTSPRAIEPLKLDTRDQYLGERPLLLTENFPNPFGLWTIRI
jgi:hypothetical protein